MAISVHVGAADVARICLERDPIEASAVPMLNLGLNIKIPVMDLIAALADFQKGVDVAALSNMESKVPTAVPGRQQAPTPVAHVAADQLGGYDAFVPQAAAAAGPVAAAQQAQAPPVPPVAPPAPQLLGPVAAEGLMDAIAERQAQQITWQNSITDLQPTHDDYVKRTKWKAPARGEGEKRAAWHLSDVSCLRGYPARAYEPPRPVPILPGRRGPTPQELAAWRGPPPAQSPPGPGQGRVDAMGRFVQPPPGVVPPPPAPGAGPADGLKDGWGGPPPGLSAPAGAGPVAPGPAGAGPAPFFHNPAQAGAQQGDGEPARDCKHQ